MDAATIRNRLSGQGELRRHRNGTWTLAKRHFADQWWTPVLRRAVAAAIPGARVLMAGEYPCADRSMQTAVLLFEA